MFKFWACLFFLKRVLLCKKRKVGIRFPLFFLQKKEFHLLPHAEFRFNRRCLDN